ICGYSFNPPITQISAGLSRRTSSGYGGREGMIYGCIRAWRECPNLLLWNIGAWGTLTLLASSAAEELLWKPRCPSLPPTSATSAEVLHDAVHSEAFRFAQLGVAILFLLLMILAVTRGVYQRLRRNSVASQSVRPKSIDAASATANRAAPFTVTATPNNWDSPSRRPAVNSRHGDRGPQLTSRSCRLKTVRPSTSHGAQELQRSSGAVSPWGPAGCGGT